MTHSRRSRTSARKPTKPSWQLLTVEATEQSVDVEGFLTRYVELLLSHPTNNGADHHD